MELYLLKFIYLLTMIVATLVAGLLPLRVLRFLRHSAAHATSSRQHKHVSLILCLLTCFSGGVFLATCFLHLFPELVEQVHELQEHYDWKVDYPLAELLSCLGFFFLFFIEETVILAIPSMAHSHGGHPHGHNEVPVEQDNGCCMTGNFVAVAETKTELTKRTSRKLKSHDEETGSMLEESVLSDDQEAHGHCQKHCPLTVHTRTMGSGRNSPECTAATIEVYTALAVAEPERCETNCEKVNEDPPILMKSSPHAHSHGVRSITLVLALSMHSLIEGMALGFGNETSEVTALFLSLIVHKIIVAFSVGIQLARTHAHQLRLVGYSFFHKTVFSQVIISMFVFACMSPLGALVGMLVQSMASESFGKDFAITIMQGLAVGTFLYVTFFEVLLHERDNEHPNLLKLLVMLLGFTLIGLLRLLDDHSHGGHSHGPSNATVSEH